MGSLRRECLDHMLILNEPHLQRIVREYGVYFNRIRPHQGIGQRIPELEAPAPIESPLPGAVIRHPILGGLHYNYRRVAQN